MLRSADRLTRLGRDGSGRQAKRAGSAPQARPPAGRSAGKYREGGQRLHSRGGLFSGLPNSKQITLFTRELGILLAAGLPIDQSLVLLEKDTPNGKMRRLIGAISEQIRNGKSLHEALSAQPAAFPPVYTSMVRVAEASGTLETVLIRIAQSREKRREAGEQGVLADAVPGHVDRHGHRRRHDHADVRRAALQGHDHAARPDQVPDQARFVIALSDWLIDNGQMILVSVSALALITLLAWQRGWGRQAIEDMLLRTPVIGHVMRLNLTVRFCPHARRPARKRRGTSLRR